MIHRPAHNLRAARQPELGEDVGDVLLDRALTQHQLVGDVAVGQPSGDQSGDLAFAPSQIV